MTREEMLEARKKIDDALEHGLKEAKGNRVSEQYGREMAASHHYHLTSLAMIDPNWQPEWPWDHRRRPQ